MSQNDLARILGLTPGAISFWEQGRAGPSYETLQELPNALGKSLEWLVSGKEETDTRAITSPERKVIRTMKRMSPSQQEMLAGMVHGVMPPPTRKRQ